MLETTFPSYTRMELHGLSAVFCYQRLLLGPQWRRERIPREISLRERPGRVGDLPRCWRSIRSTRCTGGFENGASWLVAATDVITALRCGVILPEFALRQPNQIGIRQRTPAELTELSERAEYVGSPEHKLERWWGGLPMGRQLPGGRVGRPGKETTTICRLTRKADRAMATEWVRAAILLGQCRFYESDRDFPKKVWYEADGQIWMGLLVNAGPGEYKGWPICERYRNAVFGRMD